MRFAPCRAFVGCPLKAPCCPTPENGPRTDLVSEPPREVSLTNYLTNLQFHQVIWLFPAAMAFHFLEEAPGFANWAQKYASPKFTQSRWNRIHAVGLAYACAFTGIVSRYPNRLTVFLFFAFCFSESVMNSVFHFGVSLRFHSYSPGLIGALCLYSPVFWLVTRSAWRQGLLTPVLFMVAILTAAVVHAIDVSSSVFLVSPLWLIQRSLDRFQVGGPVQVTKLQRKTRFLN